MHIKSYKNRIKFLFFSFLISSFFISTCSLDDNSYERNVIIRKIVNDIDTLTFWEKSSVYVIQKSDFTVKDTLIIQSGTIIKFNPDSNCSINISENGLLVAQGSISEPIIFTSLNDPKYNNANQETKNPKVGDWNAIIINGSKISVFNLCEFYYGGGGEQKCTIKIGAGYSANITNCTFANNDGGTLETGNGVIDASQSSSTTLIRFNTFYLNNLPVSINTSFSMDNSNVFHNPQYTSEQNTYNGILVKSPVPVNNSLVWSEDEVAYVISGPNFDISPNASLLFGNDVVIKFMKNTKMTIEGANSTIINYDGPGVIFTSIFDDVHKGDTNGDGNSTSPSAGDWSITVADTSAFEWNDIFYATINNK